MVDLAREAFPHRFPTSYGSEIVRVLVTVEPKMYREAIALAVQHHRPDAEVLLVPESVMDGQVKDFAPHVLAPTDGHAAEAPADSMLA